nr:hypothetical protein [Micromonospora sp. DSM 115978]
LKLAELRGQLTEAQARRWAEVKAGYLRGRTLGHGVDPIDRAVGAVTLVADRVAALTDALTGVSLPQETW